MKSRSEHREFQRSYFNNAVDFFRQPLPVDVEKRTAAIVDLAQLRANDKVLDVGTGTGVLVRYFIEHGVPPESITGCDLSRQMLDEAQSRYPSANFVQSDIDELASDYGPFDVAFFNGCFGNMYDPKATLRRTSTLLSPGGRIVISHPLGNNFLAGLKNNEPDLVLRLLPSRAELEQWGAEELNMNLALFQDSGDFYIAILEKAEVTGGKD